MKGIKLWLGCFQVLVLVILLGLAVKQDRTHFQADLLSILPANEQSALIKNAEKWFFDQYKTRVMVTLSGENAIVAHDHLRQVFSQKGWLDTSLQSLDVSEITKFYAQFQGALLTKSYQALLEKPELLVPFATEKLTSTVNPFVGASFNQDPSLSVADFTEQQLSDNSVVSVKNDRLVINDNGRTNYLLVLNLPEESTGLVNSQITSKELLGYFTSIQQSYTSVKMVYSGIIFHTAENAAQAEFEMSFFGGVSMLGMLIIIVWVFRSILPIVGALLTIANAVLAGLTALVWIFPSVHMLSFVFGITLIGIAIDYSFHIMVEYLKEPKDRENQSSNRLDKRASLISHKKVVRSIFLGFITTALGYLVFAFAPLDLMPQIAAFVIAGLAGALAFSTLLLPSLMLSMPTIKFNFPIIENVIRLFKKIKEHSRVITITLSVVLVMAYAVVPLKFDDNIRLLNASSKQLLANEKTHQLLLNNDNVHRFYVSADSFQALLELEENITSEIIQKVPNAKVNTLSDWVPSKKKQELSFELLSAAQKRGVFDELSTMFDYPISFDKLNYLEEVDLNNSPISLITYSKLYHSKFNVGVSDNHAERQGYVSLMEVKGLDQLQLNALVVQLAGKYNQQVSYADKASTLTKVLTEFRLQLYWGFIFVFVIILLIFSWFFTIKAAVKSGILLAIVVALSLYASMLVQQTLNIFNVFSIMLILALAIDYLIFYRERGLLMSNVLAISLSAISSILVFGMLSFSKTPAVFSFGLTVMFGIAFIYLLAPIVVKESYEK
ncbi:MMPL family transporter [Thalassotalea piscium]